MKKTIIPILALLALVACTSGQKKNAAKEAVSQESNEESYNEGEYLGDSDYDEEEVIVYEDDIVPLIPEDYLLDDGQEYPDIEVVSVEKSDGVATLEDSAIEFSMVEEKPKFNGGDLDSFSEWVNKRIQYPADAKQQGHQGRVIVKFIIDKDGNLASAKVVRGTDTSLDQEALRVINSSPKWTPGKQSGEKVAVAITYPVVFKLQ